jgi:tyrosine-protein kinase Etk/Wzc
LGSGESNGEENNSISKYVLGEKEEVQPLSMNAYLDALYRNRAEENGMDIVGNKRFAALITELEKKYECIVVNSADASKSAEAYAVSKFCNKTFVVCGRKTVKNEELYRAKNIADVNAIQIDGVLVYEL